MMSAGVLALLKAGGQSVRYSWAPLSVYTLIWKNKINPAVKIPQGIFLQKIPHRFLGAVF
jgi:hypothetical protein